MLRQHENDIFIDDFQCSLTELQAVVPQYPELPDGMIVRTYDDSVLRLHSADTQYAGETPWAIGDYIIANAATIIEAIKAARDSTPEKSLADLIATKTTAIQAEKCCVRDAGFEVDGIHYDSDQAARMSYLEFAMEITAVPTYSKTWKASEGVWVTMDAALFAKVKAAGEAHMSAAFSWQAARDAELATIKSAVAAGTMTEEAAKTAVEDVSATYME